MCVAALLVELHVHASQSLKQKRGVLKSLKQRIRNRFNVSVAEVAGQETWQRATLGCGAVGSDPVELRGRFDRIVDFIEAQGLAEVTGHDVEMLSLPFETQRASEADWAQADADEYDWQDAEEG